LHLRVPARAKSHLDEASSRGTGAPRSRCDGYRVQLLCVPGSLIR
jgi:hypothetical protein